MPCLRFVEAVELAMVALDKAFHEGAGICSRRTVRVCHKRLEYPTSDLAGLAAFLLFECGRLVHKGGGRCGRQGRGSISWRYNRKIHGYRSSLPGGHKDVSWDPASQAVVLRWQLLVLLSQRALPLYLAMLCDPWKLLPSAGR